MSFLSRRFASFGYFLLVATLAHAQEIIKNPNKPLNPEAGRTIQLREVLRIRDDGKDVVFKYPGHLQIGSDGSIYISNMPSHLKYDAAGKLVFKIVRDGEGPGEAQFSSNALVLKDAILVQAWTPRKLMRFDLTGEFLGEAKTPGKPIDLAVEFDGKLYGFQEGDPSFEGATSAGFHEVAYTLGVTDLELGALKPLHAFPRRWRLDRGRAWQWAPFDFAYLDREHLFVLHTEDYGISVFSIDKNSVKSIIKRDYPRVKEPPVDTSKRRPGGLYPPQCEYSFDVRDLILFGDKLWAGTSTVDKDGLRLIDVFDKDGRYLDNFYLAYPAGFTPVQYNPGFFAAHGGFLYSIDQDAEGYASIGKYALGDPGKRDLK